MSGFNKKLSTNKYPKRLWLLEGPPASGKSTFATQMRGPILPIDADQRFSEVADLAKSEVWEFSDDPHHHVDAPTIARLLEANMPDSKVGTIVVDSLTAVLLPKITKAVISNRAGENRNQMSAFVDKAMIMRTLQDAVTAWGTDVLWVSHVMMGRDQNANLTEKSTLTSTEYERLKRSLNLHLKVKIEGKKQGIFVEWARRGKSGMTIWDDSDHWVGMPEKIEKAVYGGADYSFKSPEDAQSWAITQKVYETPEEAKTAYDQLKIKVKPTTPQAMWDSWGLFVTKLKGKQRETFSEVGGE